jgi:hypothetical protein
MYFVVSYSYTDETYFNIIHSQCPPLPLWKELTTKFYHFWTLCLSDTCCREGEVIYLFGKFKRRKGKSSTQLFLFLLETELPLG